MFQIADVARFIKILNIWDVTRKRVTIGISHES